MPCADSTSCWSACIAAAARNGLPHFIYVSVAHPAPVMQAYIATRVDAERELAIVKSRVPNISAKLSQQVVRFVQALRNQDFYKSPGVAETIDWATALTELDARSLTPQMVGDTLGALLKYQDDIARMQGDTLQKVLKEATSDN